MAFARTHDPDTSKEAARRVKVSTVKRLREEIIWALDSKGSMTDEDLLMWAQLWWGKNISPSSLRTRRSELVDAGIVEAVPDRYGTTASGRRCKLWRLKPEQRLF